ncbi:MAG: Lrp/AsnC family transcriptional regulator [Chitinophagaceae bacterium]|jgi:DNA-binding Lrp family transcriptional regulator|nr:Lrp/AsnC family transcriptional regulator [Chitinophagaceae bacterium]
MKNITKKEKAITLPDGLDEKDMAILKLLQNNAKMTVREIASAVHLSPTPVHERIKRMEDNDVIQKYVTLINPSKVRKGLTVICYVSLNMHNKNAGLKFIKSVNEMDEIMECYSISGEFDFMLKVMAENMDAYYQFHINRLSQIENINHIQSIFVMGTIKQTNNIA